MVSESVAQGASLPRGGEACIHTLPESVVSLIPWRPRCSEEAAVPLGRPQSRKRCFNARDVCCTRQQTGDLCADPFLRFRQCGSCRPQVISFCGRVGRIQLRGLAKGGGTVENFESIGCSRIERKLCGAAHWEATYARGRKCENALELRGCAPAESPDQAIARGSSSSRCP